MSQPIECQEHPEHNASDTTTLDTIWCGNCRVNFDTVDRPHGNLGSLG